MADRSVEIRDALAGWMIANAVAMEKNQDECRDAGHIVDLAPQVLLWRLRRGQRISTQYHPNRIHYFHIYVGEAMLTVWHRDSSSTTHRLVAGDAARDHLLVPPGIAHELDKCEEWLNIRLVSVLVKP
jgi:quercetin dioxygenase-like cupin family protein